MISRILSQRQAEKATPSKSPSGETGNNRENMYKQKALFLKGLNKTERASVSN
jgi:hypothetical protein